MTLAQDPTEGLFETPCFGVVAESERCQVLRIAAGSSSYFLRVPSEEDQQSCRSREKNEPFGQTSDRRPVPIVKCEPGKPAKSADFKKDAQ